MAELDREQILRDNRRICIQMEQWANASLAHRGLTATQAQILMFILSRSGQGTSLTAIHQEFGGSMAALSSMVKRLKEKGYVRVEQCAGMTAASCCLPRRRQRKWRNSSVIPPARSDSGCIPAFPRRSCLPWIVCKKRCSAICPY